MYVVTNRELASQAKEKIESLVPRMLLALGVEDAKYELHCCSYGDLKRVRGLVDGVIVDECHGLAASTRMEAYMGLRVLKWRFGLSGTPLDRQDEGNILVVGLLGPVMYKLGMGALMDMGMLTRGLFCLI